VSAHTAEAVPGRIAHALDLSNFFVADVRNGLVSRCGGVRAAASSILAGRIMVSRAITRPSFRWE
jgi:hypothetical protein